MSETKAEAKEDTRVCRLIDLLGQPCRTLPEPLPDITYDLLDAWVGKSVPALAEKLWDDISWDTKESTVRLFRVHRAQGNEFDLPTALTVNGMVEFLNTSNAPFAISFCLASDALLKATNAKSTFKEACRGMSGVNVREINAKLQDALQALNINTDKESEKIGDLYMSRFEVELDKGGTEYGAKWFSVKLTCEFRAFLAPAFAAIALAAMST